MAFSYKAKTFHTTAFFPRFKHTAFYFPPSGEPDYQIVQTIKPEACELPFRLKELRTFTCFHVSQHINMSWRSWSVRANGSQVGMSPIGSYVGGLTSKGQVGVLFWEHRGWILRMASLIKVEKQHSPSFLLIHIDDSTFHQPQAGPPFSPERETCCMLSICGAFEFLPLYKRTFRFTPAICKDCTDPSRRLAGY